MNTHCKINTIEHIIIHGNKLQIKFSTISISKLKQGSPFHWLNDQKYKSDFPCSYIRIYTWERVCSGIVEVRFGHGIIDEFKVSGDAKQSKVCLLRDRVQNVWMLLLSKLVLKQLQLANLKRMKSWSVCSENGVTDWDANLSVIARTNWSMNYSLDLIWPMSKWAMTISSIMIGPDPHKLIRDNWTMDPHTGPLKVRTNTVVNGGIGMIVWEHWISISKLQYNYRLQVNLIYHYSFKERILQ